MKLDEYIASLLHDHDCVIVPDFGGFVANYASARINMVNHRFDPPHRKISFNKLLVHNDGLLAAYVAQKQDEKYEEALRHVKDYAVYLKAELRTKRQVEIEKVGIVFHQADGTFRFEQVADARFFAEGFGLESFFCHRIERKEGLKTVLEPKAQPAVEPKVIPIQQAAPAREAEEEFPEEEFSKGGNTYRWRKWAVAAAIGLPIVGYTLWVSLGTPLLKDRGHFHYSDLNPFAEKICTTYKGRAAAFQAETMEETTNAVSAATDEKQFVQIYNEVDRDKTLVVRLKTREETTAPATMGGSYHIIGGCFSMEENAIGLVEKYRTRGNNAAILDKTGKLFRVSIASYATREQAEAALAAYRDEIPGAWLVHK